MITGKPPKKPILKHSTSQFSVSTKKVSFGGSHENSPGLEHSKTLRANIFQKFLQEEENFENLTKNIITLRNVQSADAALDESSLSEIDFLQSNADVPLHQNELQESPKDKASENKENRSLNKSKNKSKSSSSSRSRSSSSSSSSSSDSKSKSKSKKSKSSKKDKSKSESKSLSKSELKDKSKISEKNNSQIKKPENENTGNQSLELSNSSRLSLPKLLEQSLRSEMPTPIKDPQETQQKLQDPQILVVTPTGSKIPHENSPNRARANSNPHSPNQKAYLSSFLQEQWSYAKSVNDIKNNEDRAMKFSYLVNKEQDEIKHLQRPEEEDLKLSVPESHIIDRPNMEPLIGSGEANRYFMASSVKGDQSEIHNKTANDFEKSHNQSQIIGEPGEHHEGKSLLEESGMKDSKLMTQRTQKSNRENSQNVDHGAENFLSEIIKEQPNERLTTMQSDYFKDFIVDKNNVPKSAVLDRASRKLEQEFHAQNAKSYTNFGKEDLEVDLERLRNLKFDLYKKKDEMLKELSKDKTEQSKDKLNASQQSKPASYLQKDEEEESKAEKELHESIMRNTSRFETSRNYGTQAENDKVSELNESQVLRQLQETERLQKEEQEREELARIEQEKSLRKLEAANAFVQRMENIQNTMDYEDISEAFERIKIEYLEHKERERMQRIGKGFLILDEGALNEKKLLAIGFEELKENLQEALITQNAQDFRDKMLTYNSLMALRDYALYIRKKLLKEAKAKEHYRHERLLKCFGEIQTHASFCRNWLNSVKIELQTLKKLKIFEAWKADARYEKITRLTDEHIYMKELKLKRKILSTWNDEAMKYIRIPLQKGLKMKRRNLVRKAFWALKAYRVKRQISKENNMKAYMHLMSSMTKMYFKALIPYYMREQNRKVNVDEFEDYIPLRINIKDKVTKISGKEKEWALLNNEKSVVIDVVKKKGK